MSVINEALKKAKEEFREKQKEKNPGLPEFPAAPLPAVKSYSSQKRKVIVLIVLLGILSAFAVLPLLVYRINIIQNAPLYQHQEAPLATESMAKVGALPAEPRETSFLKIPRETPSPPSEAPTLNSRVILNGIMYSAKDPVAVINDELLKEGETVGDIKVVSIRRDSVDIERAGSIVTLYLKRK